jgi:hypothetical protein
MHRLRVVLAGELQDLLARDMARAEGAEAADRKIFESEGHSVRDCGREGQIVAALCGNLNPSACMDAMPRACAGRRIWTKLKADSLGEGDARFSRYRK